MRHLIGFYQKNQTTRNEEINMCKVSVVIPVYNAEKYLRECLESIRNQSLKDIQVIMVDDGSTDKSVDILQDYVNIDERFYLIQQRNLYAGNARNKGMEVARGEYIIFLDSDDIFETTMLEEMYYSAFTNDVDIVLCDAYFFDNVTKEIQEPSWILKTEYIPNNTSIFSYKEIPERIFQVTSAVPWNKLYRRTFIENNRLRFQGTKRCNDEYFVSMTLVLANNICVVNKRFVNYRTNNINSLQGMGKRQEISFDFYWALMAIQKDLLTRKIYASIEKSFVNKCLSACITTLKKQKYFSNFSKVYNFLKEKAFDELKINLFDKSFFYNSLYFDIKSNILKYDSEEFIYQEYLKTVKNKGEIYEFPFNKLDGARKIAIYGAGVVGKSFFRQITSNNYYQLVAWFDIQYKKYQEIGLQVYDTNCIIEFEFDKIVIAIEDKKIADSVYNFIVNQGIMERKIIYGV